MEADFGVVQFPGDGIDGAVGNDLVFLGDQQCVIAVGHRLHPLTAMESEAKAVSPR